ncbi:hypothetical protein PANT_13c00016 [Moesziomyces antarcticus T-34]|uniref:Uncharacterized protein n=1 Tax=Pseudozyma antarctica (strain T-34) TaxID=1151754 RepID=M9MG15_PSEA3|nr:hypothetical protein PANT_13c00016 [Moesziomyces antarcticus T-34]
MTLASSHSTEYCSQARTDALWNARLLVAQHGAVNQRICAPPSACLLLLLVALADAAEALVRHQHLLFIVSRRHHYHHPPPFHRFGVSDIDVDTSARVHSHSALVHPWPALLRFFSSATARTSSRKSVGTTGLLYIALHRSAAAPAASIA